MFCPWGLGCPAEAAVSPAGGLCVGSAGFVAVEKREVPAARCVGQCGTAPGTGGRAVSEGGGDRSRTASLGRVVRVISGRDETGPGALLSVSRVGRRKFLGELAVVVIKLVILICVWRKLVSVFLNYISR